MRLPLFHMTGIGLLLVLLSTGDINALSLVYEVKKGDSLWDIARLYKVSIAEIKRLNRLRTNRIHPGQVLRVGPKIREFPAPNGPYYWHKPQKPAQQSRRHAEAPKSRPIEDFRHARTLLRAFDAEITAGLAKHKGAKRPLKGWKIVIDPGHGGMDPGAIVSNTDGISRAIYVVEDEYVYDIALRMYERLTHYGADVELTVISPNHLIRENLQASITFVHEQNEVYNDERTNRRKSGSVRPGGSNVSRRASLANQFLKGAVRKKSLFLSLHADNSPDRPKGPLVMYLNRKGKVDKRSRTFARIMKKALDEPNLDAQIRGRNLAVLRDNHANAEILVEIRNVHDKGEAWALRFHRNRQRDAERIVSGILEYVRSR